LALGYDADPLIPATTPNLAAKWNLIQVDPATGQTSRPGIFAGGDVVTSPDLVSTAAVAGLRAAAAIHAYLATLRSRDGESDSIHDVRREIEAIFA